MPEVIFILLLIRMLDKKKILGSIQSQRDSDSFQLKSNCRTSYCKNKLDRASPFGYEKWRYPYFEKYEIERMNGQLVCETIKVSVYEAHCISGK